MKTIEPTLLLDSARGIYIPQAFAKNFDRTKIRNVTDEQWATLEAGPDHEFYWDAWDEVLDSARFTDDGVEYTLYQNDDVWAVPTSWEWVDELDWFAPAESETLQRFKLPSYWASYLINGDASGLTDDEIKSVDNFIERENLKTWHCADVSEYTWFSRWCDAPNQLAGSMALYTFVKIGGGK